MDDLVSRSQFGLDVNTTQKLTRDLSVSQALDHDVVKSSAMFSGDEEFFAWARCVSRLTQMG